VYKLILSIFVIFLISCSKDDTTDLELEQNIYEKNILEDYELFENANILISNGQLDEALIELDKLEVLFPNSIYANKGMLVSAYIYFLKKDYEKTRAIANSFKSYYPGSNDLVYANYLEAMTYYILIKKSEYSQKNASIALNKFNFMLNAFPNNKYEIDIITKVQIIDNKIAENNLNIAKFYYNENNLSGALVYFKNIFENHSSSLSIEECLYYLTRIYKTLKEEDISRSYAAILAYNFPNSMWYDKSFSLINDIDVEKDKQNWFDKLNPVKLIINDQKEENFEIQKID